MSERDTENVVELLRPLLKDLHVQDLRHEPITARASKYRNLVVAGMRRCIIAARKAEITDDTRGFLTFSYNKEKNVFLFIINVNKNLFEKNDHESKVRRKAVAVHEFTHCAAFLLLLSCLRPEVFIEKTRGIINQKVKLTTSSEFNSLLSSLRKLGKNGVSTQQTELLTDWHFRIAVDDGFRGNYGDLYLNFLLSYQLLKETIEAIKYKNPNIEFEELLPAVHKELVEKKALQRDFVFGRIRTFIPNIFLDFA
jgi:hypothetical protein